MKLSTFLLTCHGCCIKVWRFRKCWSHLSFDHLFNFAASCSWKVLPFSGKSAPSWQHRKVLRAEVTTGLNPRNYPHLSTSSVMMSQLHLTWEEASTAGGTMGAIHPPGHAPGGCSQVGGGARDEAEAGSRQAHYWVRWRGQWQETNKGCLCIVSSSPETENDVGNKVFHPKDSPERFSVIPVIEENISYCETVKGRGRFMF